MEIFEAIDSLITNLLAMLGSFGAVLGCVFILFESIIPILPLSVFITLNFITFGNFLGFIISWVCTVIGCVMSYYIFRNGVSDRLYNRFKSNDKLGKFLDLVSNISFANLVTLIAIPFTPAFLINIASGISRVDFKKFFLALVIGKVSLVYFWGYIGTSLIDSLKNPIILVRVGVILVVVYLISFMLSKKFKIR